ncbi:DUF2634 domain-containing protein [Clostridium aminobutyricum]|uniref:DUF2634 domain-containing protein n=1 Tax=Clostridium aminobutyricum TaxID=33953 RepID=A0A939D9F7_CLOAM|nr:DUF2634 domain-containing protein [Clostridium aminobutyricum]MBN7773163.1 DUF2634 domain-containing protein [Clostridium aminobutyricum]
MFPNTEITEIAVTEEETNMGTSFLFDFKRGDFVTVDGKVTAVSGLGAVKGWIKKVLNTEKGKFKIYETDESQEYGVKLKDFVTSGYSTDFVQIELEREIKEALARNTDITRVHTFEFEKNKRKLTCSFTVETVYGTTGGEVIL